MGIVPPDDCVAGENDSYRRRPDDRSDVFEILSVSCVTLKKEVWPFGNMIIYADTDTIRA